MGETVWVGFMSQTLPSKKFGEAKRVSDKWWTRNQKRRSSVILLFHI